ncbi:rhomboid family intramembrane serine protease [Flavobacterium terrae]|uniref:Rhomboid family protein n=1 Tax=Flavobacterium terrae TaxID=415425 RepID=A0A1M6H8Q6_9FLAO|nr:rhomboid family intramembrane serine protease [Flavobacterium terrae]SHJ18572.1 Rhomboid family protein [Flavobacterium terrae]
MNPILLGIIGTNLLISYKAFQDISFFRKYEFHIASIRAGEQIRMLSSAFLHADWAHLFFNMFTLYMFAPVVLNIMGNISFLLVYTGSLICGSLLTLYFHQNDYSYRAVGASGAVTGVIFSSILLEDRLMIFGFLPGSLYGFIYLLSSIYGMKAKNDNIGHTAHFGGAIGGYVITLSQMPILFVENTYMVILLAVPIVILFYLAKTGKI